LKPGLEASARLSEQIGLHLWEYVFIKMKVFVDFDNPMHVSQVLCSFNFSTFMAQMNA